MRYPTLTQNSMQQLVTQEFSGYNHNLRIADGELYEMNNLTTDNYPMLSTRARRTKYAKVTGSANGIIAKAQLAWIDGTKLYYGGQELTNKLPAALTNGAKQLVSMGAYLIILPDKMYINVEKTTDAGMIENEYTLAATSTSGVTLEMCDQSGAEYEVKSIGTDAPENPSNGDYWIDTSNADLHALKQYSTSQEMWVDVLTTYVKISAQGIGSGFEAFDGIKMSGISDGTQGAKRAVRKQLKALDGYNTIEQVGTDYIVVTGILDNVWQKTSGTFTVTRKMPKLDFITESNNRLWGCYYGLGDDRKPLNEIYCCALGDFKNWTRYAGIATDSYSASVGSDGPWTGAATVSGYPVFWKESRMHKVFPSSTGAHQITDVECRGVQSGCSKSLAVVDERLYYKTRDGIACYDGSLPALISDNLGQEKYYDAVAGGYDGKYVVSMKDKSGAAHMFTYDGSMGSWVHESGVYAKGMARLGDDLYMLQDGMIATTGTETILSSGTDADGTAALSWGFTTGIMGFETVEQKYCSRFEIRMKLAQGATARAYIAHDSGAWEDAGQVAGTGLKTYLLPVRPRRCDHFQVKLEGTGECVIYSFASKLEVGSDHVH